MEGVSKLHTLSRESVCVLLAGTGSELITCNMMSTPHVTPHACTWQYYKWGDIVLGLNQQDSRADLSDLCWVNELDSSMWGAPCVVESALLSCSMGQACFVYVCVQCVVVLRQVCCHVCVGESASYVCMC